MRFLVLPTVQIPQAGRLTDKSVEVYQEEEKAVIWDDQQRSH